MCVDPVVAELVADLPGDRYIARRQQDGAQGATFLLETTLEVALLRPDLFSPAGVFSGDIRGTPRPWLMG